MKISKRKPDVHASFEKGMKNSFQIASYAIIAGSIMDLVNFSAEIKYLNYLNIGTVIISVLLLVLYYSHKIPYSTGFIILIYAFLANIFIGQFINKISIDNSSLVNFFLRDSLFVILILTLASFTIHRMHAIIIGIIYFIISIVFSLVVNNAFLNDSLVLLTTIILSYCGLIWYLVGIFEKAITDQQKQSALNKEQSAELLRRNEELAKLNQSKDMLLSIIGHDLKNPFNTILLSVQLLGSRFDTLSNEKKKNIIDIIESTSVKTYLLLENLLKWGRMQTESVKFKPEVFDLKQIIRDSLDLTLEEIKKKIISVDFEFDLNYQVYADKDMISTVVRNLLFNAVKFTPDQGHISVTCYSTGDLIGCTITDNGIGLKKQEMENLFNLDKLVIGIGTQGEVGTGLGLILCKDFLDMNQGNIEVKSIEGAGSSFSFTLPKPQLS